MADGDQSEQLPVVRPRRAFAWTCPACNTENLDRAVEVVFDDPEEEAEIRAQLEMEDHEKVVTTPDSATCRHCLGMVRLVVCDCDACEGDDDSSEFDEDTEDGSSEDDIYDLV